MTKHLEVIETPEQKRIRTLLADFPYSGTVNLDFGEMTYKRIAENLAKLQNVLQQAVQVNTTIAGQYINLKKDVEAMRRVLGINTETVKS